MAKRTINSKLSWIQNSQTIKLMNEQHSFYSYIHCPRVFFPVVTMYRVLVVKTLRWWLQKVRNVGKSSMPKESCPIKEREVCFWLLIIIDKLEPTVIFWPQTQINQLKTACSCTTANHSQALEDDPLSPTSTMSWLLCSICASDSRSSTHLILYSPTNQECSQC